MSVNDSSVILTARNNMIHSTFGLTDYTFFVAMLCVSTAIGVYFGFFNKKQETTTEYLLGGKKLGSFPVAMSITASHLSGITLLGIPSEVYLFGTQYAACIVTTIFTGLLMAFIFLPVFYKLQLTSTFEYLEVRFARSVRQFASVLYTLALILHTPIVIYVPALAFSQVTGFGLHYITLVICIVCIFYTTVGGLKAVVYTDTIQFMVTVCVLFVVLTLGVISVGGFAEIWHIAEEGDRLVFFNMDPSPFARTSFWGMAFGVTSTWIANIGISQGSMQRFLATPSISNAKMSILLMCIGLMSVKCLSVYTGLIMFAKYHDCDPIATKTVTRPDQILPYYVMDIAGHIPGLPGLFLAALVSSALSTMSGGLNTAAGTIWEDFVSPWIPESDTKQKTATRVMKVTVVVLGLICLGLVFIVEHLGEIFAISTSMHGVTAGTLAGLFSLGVLVPWATYKGAVIGGGMGFLTSAWIIIGAQVHKFRGTIHDEPLPTSTENCSYPLNVTDWTKPTRTPLEPGDEPMILFTISFLYYALIGLVTVLVCGTIASFITGPSDLNELNSDHFSPVVRRLIPRKKYAEVPLAAMPTKPSGGNAEKEAMLNSPDFAT